jgi:hypothetical protein
VGGNTSDRESLPSNTNRDHFRAFSNLWGYIITYARASQKKASTVLIYRFVDIIQTNNLTSFWCPYRVRSTRPRFVISSIASNARFLLLFSTVDRTQWVNSHKTFDNPVPHINCFDRVVISFSNAIAYHYSLFKQRIMAFRTLKGMIYLGITDFISYKPTLHDYYGINICRLQLVVPRNTYFLLNHEQ